MEKKSIMTIPNFNGDRALICPLLDFVGIRSSSGYGTGTSAGDGIERNISVVPIADKNSHQLMVKYVGANARQKSLSFQKVEVQSDFFKNGKRTVRYVYTLTDVTINQIIMYDAIGSVPKTLTVDLYFKEVSFKQY